MYVRLFSFKPKNEGNMIRPLTFSLSHFPLPAMLLLVNGTQSEWLLLLPIERLSVEDKILQQAIALALLLGPVRALGLVLALLFNPLPKHDAPTLMKHQSIQGRGKGKEKENLMVMHVFFSFSCYLPTKLRILPNICSVLATSFQFKFIKYNLYKFRNPEKPDHSWEKCVRWWGYVRRWFTDDRGAVSETNKPGLPHDLLHICLKASGNNWWNASKHQVNCPKLVN